jgi:hypothetical protein
MVDATVTRVDPLHSCNANMLFVKFTKANATDVLNIPSQYGRTVVYTDIVGSDGYTKDVPTGITSLAITLQTGTGVCHGIVVVQT